MLRNCFGFKKQCKISCPKRFGAFEKRTPGNERNEQLTVIFTAPQWWILAER